MLLAAFAVVSVGLRSCAVQCHAHTFCAKFTVFLCEHYSAILTIILPWDPLECSITSGKCGSGSDGGGSSYGGSGSYGGRGIYSGDGSEW